jgi:hypothetical protein
MPIFIAIVNKSQAFSCGEASRFIKEVLGCRRPRDDGAALDLQTTRCPLAKVPEVG